jgi:Viral BACON domain
VFGDYCSGEVFSWNGSTQNVLLDTTMNISSFGEDQQGELLVVGLGGIISRLVACTYSILPAGTTVALAGGSGTVAVTAPAGCAWSADTSSSWIKVSRGAGGSGDGSLSYTVQKLSGKATSRTGTILIAGQTFTITQR